MSETVNVWHKMDIFGNFCLLVRAYISEELQIIFSSLGFFAEKIHLRSHRAPCAYTKLGGLKTRNIVGSMAWSTNIWHEVMFLSSYVFVVMAEMFWDLHFLAVFSKINKPRMWKMSQQKNDICIHLVLMKNVVEIDEFEEEQLDKKHGAQYGWWRGKES